MPRLDLNLTQAYISAAFALARHGSTFSAEASDLIHELAAPEVVASELFFGIESNPANAFESTLKAKAWDFVRASK